MKLTRPILALVVLLLAACGGEQGGTAAVDEAFSATLQPSDAGLAEIYNRSCRSCHTVTATGAPLTGDAVAWGPRMAKGMEVLLDSVVNGFGGMPPFGLCMDCSVEDFEALVVFMAGAPAQ